MTDTASAAPTPRPACRICGKEFDTQGQVNLHIIGAHRERTKHAKGKTTKASPATREQVTITAPIEAEIAKVVDESIGYVRGVGMLLAASIAPHTGYAIAGVQGEKGNGIEEPEGSGDWWIVRSRAVMARPTILDQCKRDIRVYQFLVNFNKFMRSSAAAEAVAGVAAAAVVDAGVPANVGLKLGRMQLAPIPMVIPDVLAFVEYEQQQALGEQPAPPGVNGHQPTAPEGETVPGGVEAT